MEVKAMAYAKGRGHARQAMETRECMTPGVAWRKENRIWEWVRLEG